MDDDSVDPWTGFVRVYLWVIPEGDQLASCKDCADAAQRLSDEVWELKQVLARCLEEMYQAGANYKWLKDYLEAKYPELFPRGQGLA